MSRFLNWLESKKGFLTSVTIISGVSALFRLIRITFPSSRVFDEVYSPDFAWKFLHGESFYDVHPILAEIPHSIGLTLFGDTPLGWRFSPWIWGILFVWGAAYAAYLITNKRLAGVIAALLVSLDTAFFVYGRTGLPDMFLLSQLSLSIAFFFASMRTKNMTKAYWAALLSGIFMGNNISTKWLGLAIIGSVWFWILMNMYLAKRKKEGKFSGEVLLPNVRMAHLPIFFLLIPVLTYVFWLIPLIKWQGTWSATWARVVWWHKSVLGYHENLTATHPYGSKWWQWPLLLKPVLFYWNQEENGRRIINATGNVVLWWSGFAAVFLGFISLFKKFNPKILWLIVSVLIFWLPWAVITRVSFNYHFFSPFFFEVLLLSFALTFLVEKKKYQPYVYAFLILAAVGFIILYPSVTGLWVSNSIKPISFILPY